MKIPPHAQRVFKGMIYSVYQWEQERFDGTTSVYEMISRPHSAMVIPTEGNKILLSRQEQPRTGVYYSLLGGQINEDEQPLDAAKRELLEEAGYTSTNWEPYKTFEPMHKFDWLMHVFIARNCKKEAEQHLDPGEKIEIIKVSFDELIEIVESTDFWGKELTLDIFRMKKEGKLEDIRKKLFET